MTTLPESSSTRIYARLARHVVPYWRYFALSMVTMTLLAATEPAIPALLKPLLDGGLSVATKGRAAYEIPLLVVGLFLVRGILIYVSTVSLHWVANKVVMDLRVAMFERLVRLPARFYDDNTSGTLLSKLSYDVAQIADAAIRILQVVVKDTLAILGLTAYLVWLNWQLSLTVLAVAPMVGFVVYSLSRRLRSMSRELQQSMGGITQVAQEAIEGHKVVKIFAGQAYEGARFLAAADGVRSAGLKVVMAATANVPSIQFILSIALAFMIYIATREAAAGTLSVGDFVSFFTGMTLLLSPVKRLTSVNEYIQRGLAAADSAFALMDIPPEEDPGTVAIGRATGAVSFCHVFLSYRDGHDPALADLNLTIHPGETIALVGPSGSGKTSLVGLVPRLYEPTAGMVLVDGQNLHDLTLPSLRNNISLVSQDVVLFNDTLYNNIAYGAMREVAPEAVYRAAAAAHVTDFVERLPRKFDTEVGENGIRLSGGERQRIAIARALLKDAPILILDEATSALDSVSERHIQDALSVLRRGRTCLVIAHRLSTVESADRIVVLERGRVAECGSHAELITQGGLYARLHAMQLAGLGTAAASADTDGGAE